MKTQVKKKLTFKKGAIVELNDDRLFEIDGGWKSNMGQDTNRPTDGISVSQ